MQSSPIQKTLVIQQQVELPVVALIAAVVGKTRLIDNELITEKSMNNQHSNVQTLAAGMRQTLFLDKTRFFRWLDPDRLGLSSDFLRRVSTHELATGKKWSAFLPLWIIVAVADSAGFASLLTLGVDSADPKGRFGPGRAGNSRLRIFHAAGYYLGPWAFARQVPASWIQR